MGESIKFKHDFEEEQSKLDLADLMFELRNQISFRRMSMWYDEIFNQLEELRDPVRAVQMEAYMRNQFPFLGISAAPRKAVYQKAFRNALKRRED